MERSEWLNQMREKTEALYDHFSPLYWDRLGSSLSETHVRFLFKFLQLLPAGSRLLSVGCGAGKYDGILQEGGHTVVGIDLSEGMLRKAKERHPTIQYEKKGMQEMDYQAEFDGIICIDALEHVFPEDWPRIVRAFSDALKPDGTLYFTLDVSASQNLDEAFAQASSQGLPVVYGEVVADVDEEFEKVIALPYDEVDIEETDKAVYHYYPSIEQVLGWLDQEQFLIEAEGKGVWYKHFVVRKG